ncbi:MAG: sensor histidine kinase [Spirosomataceae bacterium]
MYWIFKRFLYWLFVLIPLLLFLGLALESLPRKTFLWIALVGVAFLFFIFWWTLRKRFLQLKSEISAMYPKNVERRLTYFPNDPFNIVKEAVNDLLDRIESAFQLQQTFISNFSHELKNPLMKMVSQLEMAMIKPRSPEEYQKIISSVLEDLRELGHLSDTLLELAKVGDQQTEFIPATLRIDEILFDAREFLLEGQKNCRILIDFSEDSLEEEDLQVLGNAHLLRTALVNIIENGCKFSFDGCVRIRCGRQDDEVMISIQNKGFGIKSTDIPHLFDPFFRAENTAAYKGYGIGLPLVHRIVKHHKGRIKVQSIENEETIFFLYFPIASL